MRVSFEGGGDPLKPIQLDVDLAAALSEDVHYCSQKPRCCVHNYNEDKIYRNEYCVGNIRKKKSRENSLKMGSQIRQGTAKQPKSARTRFVRTSVGKPRLQP
jgi:hypothetical protein